MCGDNYSTIFQTTPEDLDMRNHISHYVADSQGAVYPIMRSRVHHKKGKLVMNRSLSRSLCGIPANVTKADFGIIVNRMCRMLFPFAFSVFNAVYWTVIASWRATKINQWWINTYWSPIGCLSILLLIGSLLLTPLVIPGKALTLISQLFEEIIGHIIPVCVKTRLTLFKLQKVFGVFVSFLAIKIIERFLHKLSWLNCFM